MQAHPGLIGSKHLGFDGRPVLPHFIGHAGRRSGGELCQGRDRCLPYIPIFILQARNHSHAPGAGQWENLQTLRNFELPKAWQPATGSGRYTYGMGGGFPGNTFEMGGCDGPCQWQQETAGGGLPCADPRDRRRSARIRVLHRVS